MAKTSLKVLVCRHQIGDPKYENYKTNNNIEESDMTTYRRNEKNPKTGEGVPDMPTLQYGNVRPDPLELLKEYMLKTHGQSGLEKLRVMSAEDAIKTLDEIKKNEQTTGIIKGRDGQEFYTMPRMKF